MYNTKYQKLEQRKRIAYWVLNNRNLEIKTWDGVKWEIWNKSCFGTGRGIRFPNFNPIRTKIIFGFEKSLEYKYKYYSALKNHQIRIRILFGLKLSSEYEYYYSIWSQLFEYYSNTDLFAHLCFQPSAILHSVSLWYLGDETDNHHK